MKVIDDERIAAFSGMAEGSIVTDAEFASIVNGYREQRDEETRRMFEHAVRTAPDHARIVTEPGFMGMRRGTVFFVSKVRGSGFGHWRVQSSNRVNSTFATTTLAALLKGSKTARELRAGSEA